MEKHQIKEIIKKSIKAWGLIVAFFIGVPLLLSPWMEQPLEVYKISINFSIIISFMFGIILLVIIVGNKINYRIFKVKSVAIGRKNYTRDIPNEYSIALGSLIYDNLLETSVDIPAIVLSLIGKSALKYDKETKTIIAEDIDISNFYECEQYVYKCIKNKERINPITFRALVINEGIKKGYIKKNNINKKKNGFKIAISMILVIIISIFLTTKISIIFNEVIGTILAMIIWISIIISPIVIINKMEMNDKNPYINTILGKKEANKLDGLKNYLEEFSIISEKEATSSVMWGDYLAYAYVFKINNKNYEDFEEFFKNNISFMDI